MPSFSWLLTAFRFLQVITISGQHMPAICSFKLMNKTTSSGGRGRIFQRLTQRPEKKKNILTSLYPFGEDFPRKGNFSAQRKSLTTPHTFEILLPHFSIYFCNQAVQKDTYKSQVSAWDQLAEKTSKWKSAVLQLNLSLSFCVVSFISLSIILLVLFWQGLL